ncbi:MAG: hypothetical protein FJ102_11025 [Deltaproteobacteria bacterium]|nr:hypothetical protein [Deltaproteobacteria bacterium]
MTRLASVIGRAPEQAQAALGGTLQQDVVLGWWWSPGATSALVAPSEARLPATVEAALWSAPGDCADQVAEATATWGEPVEVTCRAWTYSIRETGVSVALIRHGAECVVRATRLATGAPGLHPAPHAAPCPSEVVSAWQARVGASWPEIDRRVRQVAGAAVHPVTVAPEEALGTVRLSLWAAWLGPAGSCPIVIDALAREIGEMPQPLVSRVRSGEFQGWAGDTLVVTVGIEGIEGDWCRVETSPTLAWL